LRFCARAYVLIHTLYPNIRKCKEKIAILHIFYGTYYLIDDKILKISVDIDDSA